MKKEAFFSIVCMCVPVCVLYCTSFPFFTKSTVWICPPLSSFLNFVFELRNLKKQRVIIEMRFSFSQISCLVSWQKSLVSLHKKTKKSIQKKHFFKEKSCFFFIFLLVQKFLFCHFFGWHYHLMRQAGSSVCSRFIFQKKKNARCLNFSYLFYTLAHPQPCLNLPPYRTKSILFVCCVRVIKSGGKKKTKSGKIKQRKMKQKNKFDWIFESLKKQNKNRISFIDFSMSSIQLALTVDFVAVG
jgi:hypothetical protein